MTKEPQEEINRLMNEKLNADKMSLNPPLKFEPQEETYQNLENKAVEEFDERFYLPFHTPTEKKKEMVEYIKKVSKYVGGDTKLLTTRENVIDFLKSHLQLAFKAGEEKGLNLRKAYNDPELIEQFCQQAITETEKTFGGCKKCYGKGYSTEHIGKTTAFGDFEGEKDYTVSNPHIEIRYCSCERGKELHKIQNKLITSERERIRKWAEKEWKYSFDWDTEVILIDDLLQELQNK